MPGYRPLSGRSEAGADPDPDPDLALVVHCTRLKLEKVTSHGAPPCRLTTTLPLLPAREESGKPEPDTLTTVPPVCEGEPCHG